jgi:hypothetical protein
VKEIASRHVQLCGWCWTVGVQLVMSDEVMSCSEICWIVDTSRCEGRKYIEECAIGVFRGRRKEVVGVGVGRGRWWVKVIVAR